MNNYVNDIKYRFFYGRRDNEGRDKLISNFNFGENIDLNSIITIIKKNITKNKYIATNFSLCLYDKQREKDIVKINSKYIDVFSKISYKCLSSRQWDDLRIISICYGMFSLSHIFRNKSKQKVYSSKLYHNVITKILCLIEDNKIYEANKLINSNLLKLFANKAEFIKIKQYINANKRTLITNDDYFKFINRKKMIIIGPGSNESKIENYDSERTIVTRINYFGINTIPKINRKIKTNISYYSSGTNPEIMNYDKNKYDNNLDFLCGKSDYVNKDNKRIMKGSGHVIPFGNAFMLQRVLIDLMYYNYSNVYIMNFNLYASKKRYNKEYITSESNILELIAMSGHDVEANYLLTRRLFMEGKFTCDSELEKILSSDIDYYLELLDLSFN